MPPKATLNARNLEAPGADRLTELLIEISRGNAAAQRRLRMELAGAANPGDLSKEIRKRLSSIARSRSYTTRRDTTAAGIGRRYLAAGRAEEALAIIDAAEYRETIGWDWPDFEWEDARIDVLEALGRADEAQRVRWDCFERSLSSSHLKAYLKELRDFDGLEAEERALAHAEGFRGQMEALMVPGNLAGPGAGGKTGGQACRNAGRRQLQDSHPGGKHPPSSHQLPAPSACR